MCVWARAGHFAQWCRGLVIGLAIGILAACGVPPGSGPGSSPLDPRRTAQPAPDTISPAALLAEAQVAWSALQARERIDNAAVIERVTALLNRLLQAAASIDPQLAGWRATVVLVAGESFDAWCLPQGRCALTGAMAAADDERIAAALAHELAHLLRDHPRERLALAQPALVSDIFVRQGMAPANASQAGAPVAPMGAPGAVPWLTQPYHRVHEIEADRLAVELLARAGFDPRAALRLWRALTGEPLPQPASPAPRRTAAAQTGRSASGGISFLTRHPPPPSRIRDLDIYAERLQRFFPGAER